MNRRPRRRSRASAAAGLLAAMALASCEGGTNGGNDEDPGPGGDQTPPLALVHFPPSGCLTDAAQVNLVIEAFDSTGVAEIRVGSIPAVLDSDGLWKVSAPLSLGNNTLHVETRDTVGNSNPTAAQLIVRRESALWIEPSSLAFDDPANQALVLDPVLRAIFRVQPATGVRTLLSGPGAGTGPLFARPRDMEHVASRNAVLVTDGQLDAVFLVDLGTGARSTLSSTSVGGGPPFLDVHGIALDAVRNRALVVDEARSELMAVDLVTGERSTVSGDAVGTGPALTVPRRIALDNVRNRALVTLGLAQAILAVNLGNGNRTLFSGGVAGGGPAFVDATDLVVDIFRDRALVTDAGARVVFAVALASGARQVLSSSSQGSGTAWLAPAAVALHLAGVPLVLDNSLDALVEVGAVTGDRLTITAITQGSGPQLVRPAGMDDGLGNPERFAVADTTALFEVSVASGARSLLSGQGRGGGVPFDELADVVVSRNGPSPCITVLDAGLPGIVGVSSISGNRTLISGAGVGSGPPLVAPRRMALDRTLEGCAPSVLVLDRPALDPAAILRVDLVTGERAILSDATHGLGPLLIDPVALRSDAFTGEVFVLDAEQPSIVKVDPISGDREPIFFLPSLLGTPTDLAVDEQTRTRFFVTIAEPSALLEADVTSQTTTLLSDATIGVGPLFGRPVSIELVQVTLGSLQFALVLDAARGALLVVDLVTGERLIRTK